MATARLFPGQKQTLAPHSEFTLKNPGEKLTLRSPGTAFAVSLFRIDVVSEAAPRLTQILHPRTLELFSETADDDLDEVAGGVRIAVVDRVEQL